MTANEIKNFPHDIKDARLHKVRDILYVVIHGTKVNDDGKRIVTHEILGRVKDGTYYPIEEYRKLFAKRRPVEKTQNRTYVRKKERIYQKVDHSAERKYQFPNPEEIENYPSLTEHPKARMVMIDGAIYVIECEYFRTNGKNRQKRTYLGRVRDLRYYPMNEYKRLFPRNGGHTKTKADGNTNKVATDK